MTRETAERRIDFDGAAGRGAIVFDPGRVEQARREWFDPEWWGAHASLVQSGGRGAAWFVDAPFGAAVLRQYRRGGLAARVSRACYWWQGEARVRSVAEFRLLQAMQERGVAVPRPIAASYVQRGVCYRAAILMERIAEARTLADRMLRGDAPWAEAGRLVARAHRAGLDHADLNASNILFDAGDAAWLIDLDRGVLRRAGEGWRSRNLARLHRSLMKMRGARPVEEVEHGFQVLRASYEAEFNA